MKSVLAILFVLGAATCAVLKKDTGKIVGGYEVEKADHPYQVHLRLTMSYFGGLFTSTSWGCGGSIIRNNFVLTAAHCVVDGSGKPLKASAVLVRVGQHDSSLLESHAQNHQVVEVIVHAGYNSRTMANDIALLKLEGAGIVYDAHAQPVALAAADSNPATGSEGIVSGWGTTTQQGRPSDVLLAVAVHFVDRTTCNAAYNNIVPGMICAAADGKDSCQGDSGGPLVQKSAARNGVHTLVGVVSFGMGCAQPGYPGVYAGVGYYRSWIQQNAGF